jgi:hypothetical protein
MRSTDVRGTWFFFSLAAGALALAAASCGVERPPSGPGNGGADGSEGGSGGAGDGSGGAGGASSRGGSGGSARSGGGGGDPVGTGSGGSDTGGSRGGGAGGATESGGGSGDAAGSDSARPDGGGTTADTGPQGAATFTELWDTVFGVPPAMSAQSCWGPVCHNPGKKDNVDFSSKARAYATLMPKTAALLRRVESTDKARRMPLDKPPLDPAVIARIRSWVTAGAKND